MQKIFIFLILWSVSLYPGEERVDSFSLQIAVLNNDIVGCKRAVERGARPGYGDCIGVLDDAKKVRIARFLLDNGACVKQPVRKLAGPLESLRITECSLLHVVAQARGFTGFSTPRYEVGLVKLYRERGLSPFLVNNDLETPLHYLAQTEDFYTQLEFRLALLLAGLSPTQVITLYEMKDLNGKTAFERCPPHMEKEVIALRRPYEEAKHYQKKITDFLLLDLYRPESRCLVSWLPRELVSLLANSYCQPHTEIPRLVRETPEENNK